MSPTPRPTPVRSAAAVNEAIRELWPPGAVEPTCPERYQVLLVEWADAVEAERRDVVKAA